MEIPEEITTHVKEALEEREKKEKSDREQAAKLNVSEPVKKWILNKEQDPLAGKDLNPKKLSQL